MSASSGSHSLRSGYATAAAAAGIEERKIANITRHHNLPVLRRYIRSATASDDVGEVLYKRFTAEQARCTGCERDGLRFACRRQLAMSSTRRLHAVQRASAVSRRVALRISA